MKIEETKSALKSVQHPLSTSATLPPSCYHDDTWLDLEMERIFYGGWIYVGQIDQWKRPGDFKSFNIGNVPIVVVLDKDNHLNALSNVCLHRGSEITSGEGNCKALVCPFHGWSYGYTGELISAPRMETALGFTEQNQKLKSFSVESQDGMVFVNLSPDTSPLEDWLGDFSDLHEGWSLSKLRVGRCRSFEVRCNWKMFNEVFNEYYHLPYVHRDSISHYYPEPDATDPVMGEYTTQFGSTDGNAALLDEDQSHSLPVIETLDDRQRNGTRYTWIYPNVTFAASADCLWMYHVYPLAADRTHVVQTVCFPESTMQREDFQAKAETYYRRFDLAIAEDIPALEKQQRGMTSPYAQQGRFSTLEPSVGNFACWYAEVMSNN